MKVGRSPRVVKRTTRNKTQSNQIKILALIKAMEDLKSQYRT